MPTNSCLNARNYFVMEAGMGDCVGKIETETILEEFVQQKLQQQQKQAAFKEDILLGRQTSSNHNIHVLVERLRDISEELESRYGQELNHKAQDWIKSATYDRFVQIAKGVFADGVTWSRIVVLFMFAVKVVFNAITSNLSDLAKDIIQFVLKFILSYGVYKWIKEQGGWLRLLSDVTPGTSRGGLLVFGGLLLLGLLLAYRNS